MAAFDWNNESRELAEITFADFGELLDPPSVDVTAHVLEMYGMLGYGIDHPPVPGAWRTYGTSRSTMARGSDAGA